ncbi:MAG TPA: Cache 3/Cache 2 fusion domain-containing protein, partial [Anaeromyxobacteraceae bacterium]|nr:Cache 3/Cache 2 fusion domain-containing protein [Anaeromyxobacteraceae bacterium]
MSLRRQIRNAAVAPAAALAAIFLGALGVATWRVGAAVEAEVGALARDRLERAVSDFRLACATAQEELARRLDAAARVAADVLARGGGFSLGEDRVSWQAVSQADGGAREVSVREPFVGEDPVVRNADFAAPSPVVDEVTRLTAAAATLFLRMDEEGNMLRVATSVKAKDGRRAVGTYVPARGADGPNPVVAAVLRGERYVGRAFVVDAWYVTSYQPLRGPGGEVVGMLFVGVRQDALAGVQRAMQETRLGATGAIAVLGAKGAQRGRPIFDAAGWKAGEDVSAVADARTGRRVLDQMIDAAPRLAAGSLATDTWTRPGHDGAPDRDRLLAYGYFAPWDWVLMAAMD